MLLRKFISGVRQKYFEPKRSLIHDVLLGNELKVYQGTVRKTVDRDDAWYYQLALNSNHVFDVGSNVGYTALIALLANKSSRVVLFDANPEALVRAASNIIYNGLSQRCYFVNGFISDRVAEKVKFYTVGTGSAGSSSSDHAKTAALLNSWFWVATTSLDEVASSLNFTPDFIKIDVEGAEYEVLLGATSLMKKHVRIMVEMHSNKDLSMLKNATNILNWCDKVGYSAWYLTEGIKMDTPELIAHRGRCHLLLQAKEMDYPEFLKGIKQGDPMVPKNLQHNEN
jgi:FkbM family methyltransferase